MPQKIVIDEDVRIAALLTDERVDELIVAQGRYQIGDVYLGRIENVLPGIDAAFVNIGASEKNGFIHVTDLGPLRRHKNAASINELLDPHQKVIVQVMKEPTGSKGPRLTGKLSLPGRYLVLQPNGQGVNISRNINAENERNRLRALGVLIKPPGTGLLIRSEANEVNEELIINDLEKLLKQWESILSASETSSPPILLNREEDFINRVLRDNASTNLSKVIVNNSDSLEKAKAFLGEETNIVIEEHKHPTNLLEHYKIDTTIYNSLKPRVDLPSGGYIIIEPTEALTVIDVNSGSFTKSANSRETVLWTNCEAAVEIARQLKLRNIGGVIIIDFIDMESRRDQLQLLEYFTSAIKNDKSRPQIAQLTELGLVELTRKRQGQNIYELFSKTCSECEGLGHLVEIPKKDDIQPIASKGGLIQSEESNKKTSKWNDKSKNLDPVEVNKEASITNSIENANQENDSESFNSKQETEIVNLEMDEEHENVFSHLGINPAILIEDQASNKNLVVNIIRSETPKKVNLEKSDDKGINNSSTILNGQNIMKNKEDNQVIEQGVKDNLSSDLDLNIDESINSNLEGESIINKEQEHPKESIETEEDLDEPRRRRRRSSASN